MAISGGHPSPSTGEHIVSMGEGFTPLEEMEFDGHRVLVKIDYLFPTGSYKDRGANGAGQQGEGTGNQKGGGGFFRKCRVRHCSLLRQGRDRL